MRRTIKLTFVAALLFSIAGCSKLKNTEWLDMERGWRVKLAASTALVEDPVLGRTETMLTSIEDDRSVMLIDTNLTFLGGKEYVSLVFDGQQMTNGMWSDFRMRLVPATEESERAFANLIERKRLAQATRQRPLPASEEDYIHLVRQDIALLVAANRTTARQAGERDYQHGPAYMFTAGHHREMPDEDLAAAFIPGFGSEQDAFKRAELLKFVPSLRERMESLRGRGDVRFTLRGEAPALPILAYLPQPSAELGEYDFDTSSFDFVDDKSPCTSAEKLQYPYQVYRQPIGLMNWVTSAENACRIKVEDVELAKRIEAARVANRLRTETEVFFRLTGEMLYNERFGLTPVFEAHKVKVILSEDKGLGETMPLGPAEGFVITPDLAVPLKP